MRKYFPIKAARDEMDARLDIVRAAGVREEWERSATDYLRYGDIADEDNNARIMAALKSNASYMFYRPGKQPATSTRKSLRDGYKRCLSR